MARTKERVTAVVLRGEKLLLIHRFREGKEYWIFPGGVEEGEDLETALRREVLEETSLALTSHRRLFDQIDDEGNTCIFYRCELAPGEPVLGGPEREAQSEENQYILEWVEWKKVTLLGFIYPSAEGLMEVLTRGAMKSKRNSKRGS